MFNRIKQKVARLLMIMSFTALIMGLFGFTPAQADDVSATVDASSIVFGSINEKATVSTVNAAGVTVNGMPVVAYVNSNPKHWNPAKALKVPFVKNYWAGVRSGKPFRLHHAQKFPDTYVGMSSDMTEHDVALTNHVKHAWQLFDFKAGEVRNRGFFTGKKWVGDCANPKPTGPPTTTIDQVVVVKQRNSMKVSIEGSLELSASVSGMVSVDCGNSSATAQFTASAEAALSGSATVTARTRQEAILKGEGELKAMLREDAKLKLKGDAVLKLEGSATATCTNTQPPTYTAPDVSATPSACVEQGKETGYIDVAVTNPNTLALPGHTYLNGGSPFDLGNITAGGGSATHRYPGLAAGTYSVKGTLTLPDGTVLSDTMSVVVPKCDTPTQNPPSITEVEQPNDVLVNNSRTIRVRGFVPAGQTATLNATAQYGTIKSGSTTSVTGQFDVTVTYEAPSEVPAGGNDTVTFMVINSSGQKDIKSVTFQIRPAPVDPL